MHTDGSRTIDLKNAVEKYKRLVYGIALNELDSRADADDVFQEVFLLYFRKAPEGGFDSEQDGARGSSRQRSITASGSITRRGTPASRRKTPTSLRRRYSQTIRKAAFSSP